MARKKKAPIMVIGLGRFGTAVATSLMQMGYEVLGVDADPKSVQMIADSITQVVEADSTEVETLRQLGASDCSTVVVGIGTDLEASVLTVLALKDLGISRIWAKATNDRHGRILEQVGATHVVYPEARMGERVAHMAVGKMIDYIEFDDNFAIAKTRAPAETAGKTLDESGVRTKHGVTVVGVKRPRTDFDYATPETLIDKDDLLIVSGRVDLVEAFCALD
ncbi:potassium channel family protein [Sphingomicrobium flavum]|uniref:potassium channel family protein n=1 Tax=Sphingomicrobium flavum TaxID=1229164 RepID=UPI0021AD7866|nr:TrkA family potassium uptake protein [Sphingomicrobium flavum]